MTIRTYGYPSQQAERVNIRLPKGMRARISAAARMNSHSANAEIVSVLEAAFPADVEPESVNQRLLQAALLLAGQWSAALEGMGVDPGNHPALQKFHQEAQKAMEAEQ